MNSRGVASRSPYVWVGGFVIATVLLSAIASRIRRGDLPFGEAAIGIALPTIPVGLLIGLVWYACVVSVARERVDWCEADRIVSLTGWATWYVLTVVSLDKGTANYFADLPIAALSGPFATTVRAIIGKRIPRVVAIVVTALIGVAVAARVWCIYPNLRE